MKLTRIIKTGASTSPQYGLNLTKEIIEKSGLAWGDYVAVFVNPKKHIVLKKVELPTLEEE